MSTINHHIEEGEPLLVTKQDYLNLTHCDSEEEANEFLQDVINKFCFVKSEIDDENHEFKTAIINSGYIYHRVSDEIKKFQCHIIDEEILNKDYKKCDESIPDESIPIESYEYKNNIPRHAPLNRKERRRRGLNASKTTKNDSEAIVKTKSDKNKSKRARKKRNTKK